MNEENQYDENDVLGRSISALKNAHVPAGPSSQTTADTLAALRRAAGAGVLQKDVTPSAGFFQKVLAMSYLHRKAAALIVAAGGLSVWAVLLAFGFFSSVTFAQVAEKLRDIKSLTYSARMTVPGATEPMVIKSEILGGRMRNELPGSTVMIMDIATSQTLILNSALKTANLTKIEVTGQPKAPIERDVISEMRSLVGKKGESVGELKIGNIKAKGFRVTESGKVMTIWVDPATDLPVRMETNVEIAGKTTNITMDDLVFDAPLDEKRFSMEIPAGYTVTKLTGSISLNIEENVVGMLRIFAKKSDGKFPVKLDDWYAIAQLASADVANVDKPAKLDSESQQLMTYTGSLTSLLFKYDLRKTYDYLPGHKLGEKDAIVFWRKDLETGKLMAVFGDLSTREITKEQLPPPSKDAVQSAPTVVPSEVLMKVNIAPAAVKLAVPASKAVADPVKVQPGN